MLRSTCLAVKSFAFCAQSVCIHWHLQLKLVIVYTKTMNSKNIIILSNQLIKDSRPSVTCGEIEAALPFRPSTHQ